MNAVNTDFHLGIRPQAISFIVRGICSLPALRMLGLGEEAL